MVKARARSTVLARSDLNVVAGALLELARESLRRNETRTTWECPVTLRGTDGNMDTTAVVVVAFGEAADKLKAHVGMGPPTTWERIKNAWKTQAPAGASSASTAALNAAQLPPDGAH